VGENVCRSGAKVEEWVKTEFRLDGFAVNEWIDGQSGTLWISVGNHFLP
jgi:hypothetical protein